MSAMSRSMVMNRREQAKHLQDYGYYKSDSNIPLRVGPIDIDFSRLQQQYFAEYFADGRWVTLTISAPTVLGAIRMLEQYVKFYPTRIRPSVVD